ncbi:MAG: hypothetical protein H0T53_03540 [Herpetosiphonaceae bacterium]|nr:hypothetical protein [Herpetosiphonaceae bacterium]
MNRKTLLRWVGGTALAGSLLTGGLVLDGAFAQTPTTGPSQTPATAPDPQNAPPLRGLDFGGRGHRGGKIDLVAATASVTGLTSDEVLQAHQAGKTFAAIAEENGNTADDVVKAAIAQLKTTLDAEVAAGTLTQAQADVQLAQAATKASMMVSQVGMPGSPGRGGPGRGGPGRGGLDMISATADVTGLSVTEVQQAHQAGKTFAAIAEENGKTADDVIKATVANAKTRLDAAVAAGTLTQAQADTQLALVTEQATEQVNHVGMPGGPDGGRGRGGRHGGLDLIGTTAEVTGLTIDEVRAELAAGRSLAQVAQDNGKTVDDVIAALETNAKSSLTQMLEQARTQMATPGGR